MVITSAFTATQLSILREAQRSHRLPAPDLRPASFWSDIDLLAFFGMIVVKDGGLALSRLGSAFLDDLDSA